MMTRRYCCVLLICAVLGLVAKPGLAQQAGDVIPGRYLVQLKSGIAPGKVIKAHGVAADFVYTAAVKGFAGFIPPGQLKTLQADPDVVSIVPDRVVKAIGDVSAAGKTGSSKPAPTTGQVVPAGVKRIGATPVANGLTGEGVGVAVVDTGLDFNHQDLPAAMPSADNPIPSFSAFGGSAQDDAGHGTHVGGIIAAKNNTIDVVGVAPQATLYAVKVLDSSGSGSDANVLAGLQWVQQNASTLKPPIRVVNMSLGRTGTRGDDGGLLEATLQALHDAGITVVVAAGNNSSLEVSQQVPAMYPQVMAIASTSAKQGTSQRFYPVIQADTASYYTSDGQYVADPATGLGIGVTISAPGEDQENVSGGYITSVGILSTKLGGGTTRMSGTSMAAPHVAGVMARLYQSGVAASDNPALIVESARQLLWSHAVGRHLTTGGLPIKSPANGYTFDGEYEGVVSVINWLQ